MDSRSLGSIRGCTIFGTIRHCPLEEVMSLPTGTAAAAGTTATSTAEPAPALSPHPMPPLTDRAAPIATTAAAGTPNSLASLVAGLSPQRQGCPQEDTDLGAMPQLPSPPAARRPQAPGAASWRCRELGEMH